MCYLNRLVLRVNVARRFSHLPFVWVLFGWFGDADDHCKTVLPSLFCAGATCSLRVANDRWKAALQSYYCSCAVYVALGISTDCCKAAWLSYSCEGANRVAFCYHWPLMFGWLGVVTDRCTAVLPSSPFVGDVLVCILMLMTVWKRYFYFSLFMWFSGSL